MVQFDYRGDGRRSRETRNCERAAVDGGSCLTSQTLHGPQRLGVYKIGLHGLECLVKNTIGKTITAIEMSLHKSAIGVENGISYKP